MTDAPPKPEREPDKRLGTVIPGGPWSGYSERMSSRAHQNIRQAEIPNIDSWWADYCRHLEAARKSFDGERG